MANVVCEISVTQEPFAARVSDIPALARLLILRA